MIKAIDITVEATAEEVLRIQLPSYRVEAELISFDRIPPLLDSVSTLQACGETFYGYYVGEELCGAISCKREDGIADIHRLMVHPEYFRKGIAGQLLAHLEALAGDRTALVVATGSKNLPAVRFYKQNGFVETGVVEVEEGLSITTFMKSKV
ncbi:GNAT family N-acetyltransferase [Paenibacillus luteus]|uniref:GNAT family N-acetyltransferase n=1 Tax=Paenibacillus luteus TaxID=2545753 RepID=UPI0011424C43|nr:GNAT family N-acetyltransferase [Paenibacillus luteus]